MRKQLLALSIAAAASLGACSTTLEVERVGTSVDSRSGFAYPLQFTQYQITITRRLAACDDEGLPVADIKAEVVVSTVDDGDHIYVIKPSSLVGPTRITEIQLAWEEGRLTSLNATAEDRSAQTVTAVASGIGKVALNAAILGVAAKPEDPQCSAKAVSELGRAKIQQGIIKDLDEKVSDTKLKLDQVALKLAKEPKNKAWLKEQSTLADALETYQKGLGTAQKELKSALEFLTHTAIITWPQSGREFVSGQADTLPTPTLMKWLTIPQRTGEDAADYRLRSASVIENETKKFSVWFRIERVGTYGRDPIKDNGTADADSADAEAGLRYRLPAQGRLVVCKEELCTSGEDNAMLKHPNPVLQLGQIFYVPFSSPMFANGSVNITFDKFGRPATAGVKRSSSAAETAAGTFRDVATDTSGVVEKLQQVPLQGLQRELAIIQAQKAVDEARNAPLDQLLRDTRLAKAEADYKAAMKALETDPNAARSALVAGFQADAALAAAEKAKIEAEIALAEARAKQAKP